MATAELTVENSVIEDLRCFICNRYLVYSPIQVTPDGNTMCGQCSAGNTEAHRVYVLEKVLRTLSFPCKNKKYGCLSTCNLDTADDHESRCHFQAYPCPFFEKWNCPWLGIIKNFRPHLDTCHKESIKNDLHFSFDVNYDKIEDFLALDQGRLYYIKYSYDSKTFNLTYSASQFVYKVQQDSKIQISNDINGDRTMILKGGTCVSYIDLAIKNNDFVLNMQPFMALLLDSKEIFCTLIFERNEQPRAVDRGSESKPKKIQAKVDKNVEAKVDKKDDTEDNKCKWRNCPLTIEGKNKKVHEKTCSYRIYRCIVTNCKQHFKSDGGEAHFQKHNIMFCQKFSSINFLTPNGIEYNMCSFINGEFVLISYTMFDCTNSQKSPFISLKGVSTGYKGGVNFTFSHTHCKNQSKSFYSKWNNVLNVFVRDLPACFYTEKFISFSLAVNAD